MKLRPLVLFTLSITVCAGGVATALSKSSPKKIGGADISRALNVPTTPAAKVLPQQLPNDPNTIDGSTNPESIPDHVAFSLFFRFLSGRTTATEKDRARSYLGHRVFACENCSSGNSQIAPSTKAQIEALLSVADEYNQQVTVLDAQAVHIRYEVPMEYHAMEMSSAAVFPHLGLQQPPPPPITPSMKVQLTALQRQKEAIVTEMIALLPQRLGAEGAAKVHKFMNEQFKRNVKYRRPGPSAPTALSD